MRKLTESETSIVATTIPFIIVLLFMLLVVVWGWFGGFAVGSVNPIVLITQIVFILIVFFLSDYLILKYAGEKDLSKEESYLFFRQRN